MAVSFCHKMQNIKIHYDSYLSWAQYLISMVSETAGFYLLQGRIQNLVENLRWSFFAKIING